MINSYKELFVWQKAMDLVAEIYRIVKLLPKEETYGLSDQMRRAAVSVPSNIVEGQARNTTRDFINFLYMVRGSNAELQTQCLIYVKLRYLGEKDIDRALFLSDEVGKMTNAMILSLKAKNPMT